MRNNKDFFYLSGLFLLLFCALQKPAYSEDIWKHGYQSDTWKQIEELQKYPLINSSDTPDWKSLYKSKDFFVRATVALTIGRIADKELLPFILQLLKDDHPLVRESAFSALLEIDSPLIKEPLIQALTTDEGLRVESAPYLRLSYLGMPDSIIHAPLYRRKEWLNSAQGTAWQNSLNDKLSNRFRERALKKSYYCLNRSEFDADENLLVRIKLINLSSLQDDYYDFSGQPGYLRPMNEDGTFLSESASQFEYESDIKNGSSLMKIAPGQSLQIDRKTKGSREPLLPGFYQFESSYYSLPVFVRIRRKKSFDEQIPNLLDYLDKQEILTLLIGNKVVISKDVLLPLLKRQVYETQRGLGSITTKGLYLASLLANIQSQDVADEVVPILLKYSQWQEGCLVGDSSGILKGFGKFAFNHYEQRILHWKESIDKGELSILISCLQLLEDKGSLTVEKAKIDLLEELLRGNLDSHLSDIYDKESLLAAIIISLIPDRLDLVENALWSYSNRPALFTTVIRFLVNGYNLKQEYQRLLWTRLWFRAKREASLDPKIREELIWTLTYLPDILFTDKSPITSPQEAIAVIENSGELTTEETKLLTIRRVEEYIGREPDPSVELKLAILLFNIKKFERSRELIDKVLTSQNGKYNRSMAHYYKGELLLVSRDITEAVSELKKAYELFDSTTSHSHYSKEIIERKLKEVEAIPVNK